MNYRFYFLLLLVSVNFFRIKGESSKNKIDHVGRVENLGINGLGRPLKDALAPLLDQEHETGYSEEEQKELKYLSSELLKGEVDLKVKDHALFNKELEKHKKRWWIKPVIASFVAAASIFYIKTLLLKKPEKKSENELRSDFDILKNNACQTQYEKTKSDNVKKATFFTGSAFLGVVAQGYRLYKIKKITQKLTLLKKQVEYLLKLEKEKKNG